MLEKKLSDAKKKDSTFSEDTFVDRVVSSGNKHINDVRNWEPVQFRLRQEHGREKSAQQPERMLEVTDILRKNPDITLDEIDRLLHSSGMSMSIIDKIYILNSRQDYNKILIQGLVAAQKEHDEFGFGNNPREDIGKLQTENNNIDERLLKFKEEYRKIFPKKEIFK